jgi:hypothetical protein
MERPKRLINSFIGKVFCITTEDRISVFVNKHRNELMLDHFEIVRLLGWTKQYEEDYYYILDTRQKGIVLFSCVGCPIPLKRKISNFDYYHLEDIWYLNGHGVYEALDKMSLQIPGIQIS